MKKKLLKKIITTLIVTIFVLTAIILPATAIENINTSNNSTNGKGGSPPTVLEFDGPSSININETATFYVKAIDPNNLQIRYLFDWKYYEKSDFNIDETTSYYGSNQSIQISHNFTIGGNYEIAVIAENINGDQSEIFVHYFNVNGGETYFEITMWTEPDRFIPNQEADVVLKMTNVGNRDAYYVGLLWTFDEKKWGTMTIIQVLEVGIPNYGSKTKIWPNDYDEHTIGLWSNVYLTKSAKENLPPIIPDKPSGPIAGYQNKEYQFIALTTDPCEHDIYYLFDWGDGELSSWLGPYKSGTSAVAKHKWYTGLYQIKVKAKDEHGLESDWSEPYNITITKDKAVNRLFFKINENILERFPIFFRLLNIF